MRNKYQEYEGCVFIVNLLHEVVYMNSSARVMFPKIKIGEKIDDIYNKETTKSLGTIEWPGIGECEVVSTNMNTKSYAKILSHFLETSHYDELFELNLTNNTYKIICHVEQKYIIPALEGSLPDMMKEVSNDMIHPDDKEKFLEFWDLDYLKHWASQKSPIIRKGYFRKKLVTGEYQMVSQIVISLYQNDLSELIVLCFIQAFDEQITDSGFNKNIGSRGLLNKADFFMKTKELLEYNHQSYALVAIDIEHFKLFNEWYGEKAGDNFLDQVAKYLQNTANQFHTYACYVSGDDFIILLPAHPEIIDTFTKQMIQDAKQYGDITFFPAIGIYEIKDMTLSISTMYDYALVALSYVKGNYAKRVSWFEEEMILNMKENYQLLTEILDGLREDEFIFYAQPKVNMITGKIISFEALVRWKHPTKGIIKPKHFVPLLEDNGFIAKLDLYIWEKVFQSLSTWLEKGHIPVPLSLNVSRIDIYSLDVVQTFIDLTQKYKVDPKLIEVEITESAYAENYDELAEIVEAFHKAGFVVLMDDFGSGYSSLNMLKDVNVDVIKIDMKFLKFKEHLTKKGIGILEAIISMARIMGLHVIVEGVETKEQRDYLVNMGCMYGQGYHFYAPMPISEFEDIIADESIIETNSLKQTGIQRIHFREFFNEDIVSESVINNILGSVAFYNVYENHVELVKVNEQYCHLTGMSPQSLEKRKKLVLEDIYQDDYKIAFQIFEEARRNVVNGGEGILRRNREDGEIIWIHLRAFILKEYNDHCLYYGSLTDVTEQKKNELQLEASQRALSAAMNLSQNDASFMKLTEENRRIAESIFAQTAPGGIMGGYCEEGYPLYFANLEMVRLLGYDSYEEFAEAIDYKAINTIHPDDQATVLQDIGPDYYQGKEFTTTYRMPKKDGTWFWILDKGRIIEADDGHLAIISVCTDISEPMLAQEQMARRNEALFKQNQELYFLNNDMPGGYHRCESNEDLDLTYISQQFLDILGYTRFEMKELFDNKLVRLFHPDDLTIIEDFVKKLTNQQNESCVCRLLSKEGYIWVLANVKYLQYKGHVFYQGIISDISETVKMRNHMNLINQYLPQDIVLLEFDQEDIKFEFLVSGLSRVWGANLLRDEKVIQREKEICQEIKESVLKDHYYYRVFKVCLENEKEAWIDLNAFYIDETNGRLRCLCVYSDIAVNPAFEQAPQFIENIIYKFYREGNIDLILEHLTEDASWIDPAQKHYLQGREAISQFLYKQHDNMFCCRISEMECILDVADQIRCRVIGKYHIMTAPETNLFIETDQRCTFDLIIYDNKFLIQHVHMSNIYEALESNEFFPKTAGKNNYEYLQKLLREKIEVIEMVNNNINGGLKGSYDDDTYSFFYVNERLPLMLGYTYNEFMEMSNGSAVGMVYPPDLPRALEEVDRCFQKGLTYSAKYRIRKKNGELIWVMDSGQKFLADDGQYKINSMIIDITDLQTLLEEREKERERYRVALKNVSDIMFEYLIDKDQLIFYDTSQELDVVKVQTISEVKQFIESGNFIHLDDLSLFYAALYNGNSSAYIRVFKSNKWHWVNIYSSLVKDEEGQYIKYVGVWNDVTDAKNEHDILVNKAQRDPLTGLYNQSMAEELIEKRMQEIQTGALLLLDVDSFKQVNDTYGHLIGNYVLKDIAKKLEAVQQEDIVGRIGGDEFIWFVADHTKAISYAKQLLHEVQDIIVKNDIVITISIGIAYINKEVMQYKKLFVKADQALYQAKANGRNQYYISEG